MRRREFIAGLGSAAAWWPIDVRAQQAALPIVGFLSGGSKLEAEFRRGLHEQGYVEGQNVAFVYRWAETQYDRLPAMAADLVLQRPAVIAATANPAAVLAAAKNGDGNRSKSTP